MNNPSPTHYLFIFRHSVEGPDPTPAEMEVIFGKWMAWMKTMKANGQYIAGDRLDEGGKVLRQPRGATVTDGPYVEAKEIVGGYIIVTAPSLAAAAELAKGCPGLENGTTVEVRPIEPLPPI
jgi:hypothetical protein